MSAFARISCGAMLLLALTKIAAGDFVGELWGNDPRCHHRDTLKITEGRVAEFDLSALPEKARIQRAVLRANFQRRDYRVPVLVYALDATQSEAGEKDLPLSLRAPWYNSFDATDAVRRARKAGAALRLHFKSAPSWQSQSTTLEIAYQGGPGKADTPTPRVSALSAVHQNGQTFLTWKEHEDIVAEDPVTTEKLEQKLLPLKGQGEVVYRVYAHDKPITVAALADSTLVAEVPFVLSAYYLDSVPTIEHPNPAHGEGSTPLMPGARARRATVPRYVVPTGRPAPATTASGPTEDLQPLPRGSGLYVRTITRDGATYYAVVAAVQGREAVAADGLYPGNSLLRPAVEKVAPVAPVMQSRTEVKNDSGKVGWIARTYNWWLEFPYVNLPRQFQAGTRETVNLDWSKQGLLWVQLGAYGSQAIFNATQRGGGEVSICPPWDIDDSILQGRHECLETLKSYDQGVVHNWGQRRTLAMVEWAKRQFPVDPQRVVVEGQFVLWALRHGDVFAGAVGDAYGNFSKGREAQKHGPSWGPYPLGSKNFAGVDQWEYMNVAKFIRENPTVELPYYVSRPTGSSHVGDIGPWAWPEVFRALHDTRRAFSARWGGPWAGSPAAGTVMLGRIKLHQSLPAFGNCSLDDCPGDGELNPGGVGGDGDPVGDINGYIVWDTEDIVDQPDRWVMTVYLYDGDQYGRGKAPADACTADLTPRRCQKFKASPNQQFNWTNTSVKEGKVIQSGTAKADKWGLVTIEGLTITKGKNRISVQRK